MSKHQHQKRNKTGKSHFKDMLSVCRSGWAGFVKIWDIRIPTLLYTAQAFVNIFGCIYVSKGTPEIHLCNRKVTRRCVEVFVAHH